MTDNPAENIDSQTRQQVFTLIRDGGATYDDITTAMDFGRSTARDHVTALKRDDGIPIGERVSRTDGKTKEFYYRPDEQEHPTNETSHQYTNTTDKAQITEDLNEQAQRMEQQLTALLAESQPAVADGGLVETPSHEDVVIHATDDHVGDLTEDEFGEVTYSPVVWRERRRKTFDTCFDLVDRQESAGYTFDNLHLLLGGDMVTGEGIYPGQAHDLEWPLDKQVEECAKFYMEQIRRAAAKFEAVQVVVQSGNHGELRFSSASGGANADRLMYLMLDGMVRQSALDNVTFVRNNSTHFTNFEMRGHNGHLRHGNDSLEHIGTSSGKRRWFNWRDKHQFDVAYRGHFHMFQYDTLTRTYEEYQYDDDGNILTDADGEPITETKTQMLPVIMTGSLKPPEEFEESIARWSQPAATIHGVSDDRPVTWFFPVEFE